MEVLLWKLLNISVALVVTFFLYTISHEMGHGIIGILCGGKIVKINIGLKAHIRIDNATYNAFTLPLMNVGGTLLPCIILFISVLVYKSDFGNALYHFIYLYFSIAIIGTLITWTVVPITPISALIQSDDDTKCFMRNSNINPFLISLTALLLCLCLIFLVIDKGIISAAFDIVVSR